MNPQVKKQIVQRLKELDKGLYPAITKKMRTEMGVDSSAETIYTLLANNQGWTFLNAATSYELTLTGQND
jgi:hypothetical protein